MALNPYKILKGELYNPSWTIATIWLVLNALIMLFSAALGTGGFVVKFGGSLLRSLYQPSAAQSMSDIKGSHANNDAEIDWNKIFPDFYLIIVICVGCLVFVASLYGILAILYPNRILLGVYFTILLLLSVALFGAFFTYWFAKDTVYDTLKNEAKSGMMGKYRGDRFNDDWSRSVSYMHRHFNCCGIDSYEDFNSSTVWVNGQRHTKTVPFRVDGNDPSSTVQLIIPASCCKFGVYSRCMTNKNGNTINVDVENTLIWNTDGCWSKIRLAGDDYVMYFAISCGVIGLCAIILLVFTYFQMKVLSVIAEFDGNADFDSNYYYDDSNLTASTGAAGGSYGYDFNPNKPLSSYIEDPQSRWNAQFGSHFYDKRIYESYGNGLR